MKMLLAFLLAAVLSYTTSYVTITGPADWGTLQPVASYSYDYSASASASALMGVSLSGDPQFTALTGNCVGVGGCPITVSFSAGLGGDYVGTLTGTSAGGGRIRSSTSSFSFKNHVIGANYTLNGVDDLNSSATYTLVSTGESDLVGLHLVASSYQPNVGRTVLASSTCPSTLPVGASCQILVKYTRPDDSGGFGYIQLQASANTRQQKPSRVTLKLPFVAD